MQAIILGGGIIGLSAAWYLNQDGWEVTVLDKGDLLDNCSWGNMGYLSPSHFVPLAAPGMVEQGLVWMFNPRSPFYVRPSLRPDFLRWGWRFVRSCTPAHVERNARPLLDLLLWSKNLFWEWQKSGELEFELEQRGCVMFYQTAKKEKEERENAHAARALGLEVEILDRDRGQALEPDLRPDVLGGVWFKGDAQLYPNALMRQLPILLEKRGVKIIRNAEVLGFEKNNGKISAVRYRSGERGHAEFQIPNSAIVVLAAGAWSAQMAKLAGERLLLMPGKGYSMTLDNPVKQLRHPCILVEAKVALTPWNQRLRIGSTMEIGPINDRILLPRVQGILDAVPRFLPGYRRDPGFCDLADEENLKKNLREKVWFGFRPVSADGMPYIGFSQKTPNLLLATGHAMLGVSLATGTGKLVAELAGGGPTSIPVAAFDPGRFG